MEKEDSKYCEKVNLVFGELNTEGRMGPLYIMP
jgi:hypothetical protein